MELKFQKQVRKDLQNAAFNRTLWNWNDEEAIQEASNKIF